MTPSTIVALIAVALACVAVVIATKAIWDGRVQTEAQRKITQGHRGTVDSLIDIVNTVSASNGKIRGKIHHLESQGTTLATSHMRQLATIRRDLNNAIHTVQPAMARQAENTTAIKNALENEVKRASQAFLALRSETHAATRAGASDQVLNADLPQVQHDVAVLRTRIENEVNVVNRNFETIQEQLRELKERTADL